MGRYYHGAGTDKNLMLAMQWLGTAGELGIADAQFMCGVMMQEGYTVTGAANQEKAKHFFTLLKENTQAPMHENARQVRICASAGAHHAVCFQNHPMLRPPRLTPRRGNSFHPERRFVGRQAGAGRAVAQAL